MILKSETYHFHRLDLTRHAGFIVTIYDEDALRLASTQPMPTPAQAFEEAWKIVHNKVEGPRKLTVPPSTMPP
jgi:predicted RNA-binding protein associated with RNAse of E/G family